MLPELSWLLNSVCVFLMTVLLMPFILRSLSFWEAVLILTLFPFYFFGLNSACHHLFIRYIVQRWSERTLGTDISFFFPPIFKLTRISLHFRRNVIFAQIFQRSSSYSTYNICTTSLMIASWYSKPLDCAGSRNLAFIRLPPVFEPHESTRCLFTFLIDLGKVR